MIKWDPVRIMLQILLPAAVGICGGWFLFALRGLGGWWKRVLAALRKSPEGEDTVSPGKALALALAGTLGVGNIAGVGSAISLGGPGALFWMLVCTAFAMLLKYAETLLAMLHRRKDPCGILHGGAMYYMPRRQGVLFSLLCLVCALTVGNAMQVRAVATVAESVAGGRIPRIGLWVGIGIAALLLPALSGKKHRLFDLAAVLVPVMTVGYLLLCCLLLIREARAIPSALAELLRCAFHPRAAAAGVMGYTVFDGIRYGVVRGLVSNEAGCGTAPIAHSATNTGASPVTQGCMGMLEVAVDTLLLCSITALCVLVTGSGNGGNPDGMRVALDAFTSVLGAPAGWILLVAVFCFAFATVLSWSYYGREALRFLFAGDRKNGIPGTGLERRIFRGFPILYSLLAIPGALLSAGWIWQIADCCIAAMTLLNLFYVMKNRHEILTQTRREGLLPPLNYKNSAL